jgi:acyl-CoA thioester hydrolase
MNQTARPQPLARDQFKIFKSISTRWMDNDCYGHVNNVVYYSWFDTAVNAYLIEQGVLDRSGGTTIGLVVSSSCNYFEPLSYPEPVEAGISGTRLGRSSVEYRIGIFRQGSSHSAAWGNFVHVYVSHLTRKPVEVLPAPFKRSLEKIYVPL